MISIKGATFPSLELLCLWSLNHRRNSTDAVFSDMEMKVDKKGKVKKKMLHIERLPIVQLLTTKELL